MVENLPFTVSFDESMQKKFPSPLLHSIPTFFEARYYYLIAYLLIQEIVQYKLGKKLHLHFFLVKQHQCRAAKRPLIPDMVKRYKIFNIVYTPLPQTEKKKHSTKILLLLVICRSRG